MKDHKFYVFSKPDEKAAVLIKCMHFWDENFYHFY